MSYTGKCALITGGGSGMGQLAARRFAKTGANVMLLDVNEAGMAETAEGHDNIFPYKVDITNFDAVKQALSEGEAKHGPVDRVYNCAAIMPFGLLTRQDNAQIHKLMQINYGGLVNITQACIPGMVERKNGEFVSFGSVAGIVPNMEMGVYGASKAAVNFHTEVLYHEHRNCGVKIALVCPPAVGTPLLQQAKDTAWPKIMDVAPPLDPNVVLDSIEDGLARSEFMIFPTKQAKLGWRMRRFLPNLVWKNVHKIEGW